MFPGGKFLLMSDPRFRSSNGVSTVNTHPLVHALLLAQEYVLSFIVCLVYPVNHVCLLLANNNVVWYCCEVGVDTDSVVCTCKARGSPPQLSDRVCMI